MSQKIILQLLRELGGRATRKQIADLARKKYPDATLYSYVGLPLRRLQRWGLVDFDGRTKEWVIVPER